MLFCLSMLGCSRQSPTADLGNSGFDEPDDELLPQIVITSESQLDEEYSAQFQGGITEKTSYEPLPLPGVEGNKKIQTYLKNANLYSGKIDGKIGPLTRRAIIDFQNMKGLKPDGKVGPSTWKQLQKYSN